MTPEQATHRPYCLVWKGRTTAEGPDLDRDCSCGVNNPSIASPGEGQAQRPAAPLTSTSATQQEVIESLERKRETVGLYSLPPAAPLRTITFLHAPGVAMQTKGHAIEVDHGVLLIKIFIGTTTFTTEAYPAGTWSDVKIPALTVEQIEAHMEALNQFYTSQAALQQEVAKAEQGAALNRALQANGKKPYLGGTH
jgi:hypothetical protein